MTGNKQAIGFMVLATLSFTVVNFSVKYVNELPVFELVFFRSIGSVLCCLMVLKKHNIPIYGNDKKLLILRGIVGVTSMALFFKAVQMMPLGSAVSLRYLSPFFAAGLAILFLKEHMKKLQWVFFATAFIGVIVLKGFDPRISMIGLAAILVSALFSGLVYVIIRKIGASEHPVVVVNYFMIISTVIGGVGSLMNWVQPIGIQWLFLVSMGFFGFIAQIFMTRALQMAETNLITPFKYTEVVFTIFVGWAFFQEPQTLIGLLGILIIITSLLANVWVKTKL